MLTKSLEDYLEAIKILTEKNRVARVKEIGKLLNVKSSSVVNALNILKKMGYIKQEKYGYVELTELGIKEAEKIQKKHDTVVKFLKDILKVSEENAKNDGCKIEHIISDETFKKLYQFLIRWEKGQT